MAERIGVTEESITNWEVNRHEPQIEYYPKIIDFLGYFPFDIDTSTLGGKIKRYRYMKGVAQEQLAKELGVNESTVFHYEKNNKKPLRKTMAKLAPTVLLQLGCILSPITGGRYVLVLIPYLFDLILNCGQNT